MRSDGVMKECCRVRLTRQLILRLLLSWVHSQEQRHGPLHLILHGIIILIADLSEERVPGIVSIRHKVTIRIKYEFSNENTFTRRWRPHGRQDKKPKCVPYIYAACFITISSSYHIYPFFLRFFSVSITHMKIKVQLTRSLTTRPPAHTYPYPH
jgi:hypothetical protein